MRMILSHLRKIRENPRFKDSRIVFAPENNYGGGVISDNLNNIVFDNIHNVAIYKAQKSKKNGFYTSHETKIQAHILANGALNKHQCFIDPRATSGMSNRQEAIAKLKLHIQRMKPTLVVKQDGTTMTIISGKHGDDGKLVKGQQDDLGILFLKHHYLYDIISNDKAHGISARDFAYT